LYQKLLIKLSKLVHEFQLKKETNVAKKWKGREIYKKCLLVRTGV